jgi:hypothetical protein
LLILAIMFRHFDFQRLLEYLAYQSVHDDRSCKRLFQIHFVGITFVFPLNKVIGYPWTSFVHRAWIWWQMPGNVNINQILHYIYLQDNVVYLYSYMLYQESALSYHIAVTKYITFTIIKYMFIFFFILVFISFYRAMEVLDFLLTFQRNLRLKVSWLYMCHYYFMELQNVYLQLGSIFCIT